MKIKEMQLFRGPNRWSSRPVWLLRFSPIPDVDARLAQLVQGIERCYRLVGLELASHPPFIDGATEDRWLPVEFEEEAFTRECVQLVLGWLERFAPDPLQMTATDERRVVDLADDLRLGPSSRAMIEAATARRIPYFRMNEGSLVQLGEGKHQRRIWTAETDATSAIAEAIASDKQLTRSILAAIGVNVPLGRLVADRDDAWQAAQEIGLPVAVKPANANHARGVSLELNDREAILAAYDWACTDGQTDKIMVEQFIVGDHHRVLVVGDRMVAAARGQREYVVGDGQRTIAELVAELNSDPRRGENYTDPLGLVPLDEAASIVLSKQRMTFDTVPASGQRVLVKHVGDLIEDCTSRVHPSTAAIAVLAAQAIGLDIAGIDMVVRDIAKPLTSQRGGIVEVNAGPSLTPHVAPLRGAPQPVGEAIVEMLFPAGGVACIQSVVVIGGEPLPAVATALDEGGRQSSRCTALFTPGQIWLDGRPVPARTSAFETIQGLLMHPRLEKLTVVCPWEEVLEAGFPLTRADALVLASDLLEAIDARPQALARLATSIRHLAGTSGKIWIPREAFDRWRLQLESADLPAERLVAFASFEDLVRQLSG